jgi:hypothetical protein
MGKITIDINTGGNSGPKRESMFCKKCNKKELVKGKANYYIDPDPLLGITLVEWECYVLECNHKIPIRKTGRTKSSI